MPFKSSKLTLIILAAIAVPLIILMVHFKIVKADVATYPLAGWIWTDNYRWISMNSDNPEIADKTFFPSSDYRVSVTGDNLSGWGWSSSVGWICFGKTCDPNNICDLASGTCDGNSFGVIKPPGNVWEAKINSNHTITGWAKVISLNDYGLIHLGMGNPPTSDPPVGQGQKGEQCYDCKASCDTWTMAGDPPKPVAPCLASSTTQFDSCNTCFTNTEFDGNKYPTSTLDFAAGGSGNICFTCHENCHKIMSNDNVNSRITCDVCDTCHYYGGAKDDSNGMLLGWAWNGNVEGASTTGAGWIQLNPTKGGAGIVYPWLQTQYGTVFGERSFTQKSAISGFNATYCIFAESVANFKSEKCATTYSGIALKFPLSNPDENVYRNALGNLDLTGLTTVANKTGGSSGQSYNKYGNMINEAGGNPTWNQPKIFNNQVYHIAGDLYVANDFQINNGGANQSGNGLVIVDGDLHINGDFGYETNVPPSNDLKQLASIAWVVKGDIKIDKGVQKIVGAFIALGKDNITCNLTGSKYDLIHCGVFDSGTNDKRGAPEDKPLTVSGLLMAKAFNFLRTYTNINRGSEQIIYDGRLSANPPPGLKSLIESLPLIRDFQY